MTLVESGLIRGIRAWSGLCDARAIQRRLVAGLRRVATWTPWDSVALGLYLVHWSDWRAFLWVERCDSTRFFASKLRSLTTACEFGLIICLQIQSGESFCARNEYTFSHQTNHLTNRLVRIGPHRGQSGQGQGTRRARCRRDGPTSGRAERIRGDDAISPLSLPLLASVLIPPPSLCDAQGVGSNHAPDRYLK